MRIDYEQILKVRKLNSLLFLQNLTTIYHSSRLYVSHFSEPIKDILKLLEKACNSADRRSLGFSAAEVAYGLSHVATNDGNKKTVCINASWTLSYEKKKKRRSCRIQEQSNIMYPIIMQKYKTIKYKINK